MKRQIVVGGTATAGKSTFSHELVKRYSIQHICIDPIIEGFEDVFPELGISHSAKTHKEQEDACQKFRPFITSVMHHLDVEDFVIEGFKLPIEDLHVNFPHVQFFLFGYPNTTPAKKVAACRKFDVHNWTNEESDESLYAWFEFLIEESKYIEEVSHKTGIPFIDTSYEFNERIQYALSLVK